MSLIKILLEGAKVEYQNEREQIVDRIEELESLLIKIENAGRWTLTTTVMGMETHYPRLEKDLNLLVRCELIKGQVKYTKHNAYLEYVVTEKGEAMVKHILTEKEK